MDHRARSPPSVEVAAHGTGLMDAAKQGAGSRIPWQDVAVAVLVTGLTLGAGWALKAPCIDATWDGFQYRHGCYSDVIAAYSYRGLDRDALPYVAHAGTNPDGTVVGTSDYPPVTGMVQYAAARLADDIASFALWTAGILGIAAVAATVLLVRLCEPRRRVAIWVIGPPLVLYAFHNWDLIPIAFVAGALVALRSGRAATSGILLAFAASAKVWPFVLVPMFAAHLVTPLHLKLGTAKRWGLGLAGAWLAINAPWAAFSPRLWAHGYAAGLDRAPTFESPLQLLRSFAEDAGESTIAAAATHPATEAAALLLLLACLAAVAWRVAQRGLPVAHACLAALVLFLLLNPVFSHESVLWLLPLLAIVPVGLGRTAVLWLADALCYVAIYGLFLALNSDKMDDRLLVLAVAVALRTGALLWILAAAVRPPPARPSPGPAPPVDGGPPPLSTAG